MFLSLKVLSILFSLSVVARAKPDDREAARKGKKRYIVMVKDSKKSDIDKPAMVKNSFPGTQGVSSDNDTQVLVENLGGTVISQNGTVLNGIQVVTLPIVNATSFVEQAGKDFYIVEDVMINLSPTETARMSQGVGADIASVSTVPPWNLDRVDQPDFPLDKSYKLRKDSTAGSGVHVCVIDSGLDPYYYNVASEIKFGGGKNWVTDGNPSAINDCNGHGTHVAGTVGSSSYGIAPGATIWVARVLNCGGGGYWSDVILAIDWCVTMGAGKKMVINISLGGGAFSAVDEAVAKARDSGIIVVVAAGNDIGDACSMSPAREPKALTVGATGSDSSWDGVYDDVRASYSNFGNCTNIFAPGTNIPSLKLNDPSTPEYFQGTSMAAPCVAGVAALFFSQHATANETEAAILANAIDSVGNSKSPKNLLVQLPGTPTRKPTAQPTLRPTTQPTGRPTPRPTTQPTLRPTHRPTSRPTNRPTGRPTNRPTNRPTRGKK